MKILITYCLVLFSSVADAQQLMPATPVGGGIYSHHFNNAFAAADNAASLSSCKNISAGVFSENRFGIKGLGLYGFALALPTSSGGAFGFNGKLFGNNDSKESCLHLAYGMSVSEWLAIGASADYFHTRVSGYGNMSAVTFNAGLQFLISKRIIAGAAVTNPARVKYNKSVDERIATVYAIGIGYEPSAKFFISLQLKRRSPANFFTLINIRYRLAKQLILETGINTFQPKAFGGFIINIKSFQIMINAAFHQRLGMTPGAVFIYKGGAE